ncbi:hypothetical protein PYH37_000436 [Sinorhizobium numidicum]|uniref:Uncharacterized protein n=1 Tax=Sinorhizobium numidicum TaxID=680248 RepID=A0ABY8CR24_9HYPH|nr:hypothetical protein [Sinorhizobium numidicum]WEX75099.1 hypothetical protein PYH37_000436 [Sinorhizobium numidicum]WEX81093.1 hypothetical protein PYH38_000438 [Sinorhizobium numidicum]
MRTLEDEIKILIAVRLAALKPSERRAFAGRDQYGRTVEVRGPEELAAKMAESFAPFAIWDGDQVHRFLAMTTFVPRALSAVPMELRIEACDRSRLKAKPHAAELPRRFRRHCCVATALSD